MPALSYILGASVSAASLLFNVPTVSVSDLISNVASKVTSRPAMAATSAPSVVYGMRKFPYPYDAMLSISSDADHETVRKFELVHAFLNTNQETPMGKGLSLDVSDSVFMYNGSDMRGYVDEFKAPIQDEMSYFVGTSSKLKDANLIDGWIHKDWIDTLHSYGDFSRMNQHQTVFTRQMAVQAVNALKKNGDYLTVWTDHGNMSNVDDFGRYGTVSFYNYQQGASPWSRYYHANVTIPYGVRFVWTDGNSDVFGRQSMIYPLKLPDGRKVWGFDRYTNSGYTKQGHPIWVWTSDDLQKELSRQNLQSLVAHHAYSIVAQHFEADNTSLPFSKSSIQTLQYVAALQKQGKILVSGTARLLTYNVSNIYASYVLSHLNGKTMIDITSIRDPVLGTKLATMRDVRGLTFYVSNPADVELEVDHQVVPVALVDRNRSDGVHPSIGVKWWGNV